MASSARIDEIKKKFDENPRRYFAPLANEFRKAGDLEQAILICEEFLPQQAGHMSGHIVYGQALFESGRLPESRTVFETALGLDPENLIALRHLGDIAKGQGDPVEARRWYDRVLEADPRNEEIQGLLAGLGSAAAAPSAAESPAAETPSPDSRAFAPAMPSLAPDAPRPELSPIDLDLDDAGFAAPGDAAPAVPPPLPPPLPEPEPAHARAEGLEPAEFEVPTQRHDRAEGLEPSVFEAPAAHPERAEGLETAEFVPSRVESPDRSLLDLESSFAAETGAPVPTSSADSVQALPGLEATSASGPASADESRMPSLGLDDGLALPPHGDAIGVGAPAPAMDDMTLADEPAPADASPMMELPPSVIAAESALMDAGVTYDGTPADEPRSATGAPAPFVTETMADLYLKQGFHAQALDVFRQLAAASPADARLRARVAELERGSAHEADTTPAGPTVREFLFRLATRRPGETAAATAPPAPSDFGSFDAIPESPAPAAVAPSSWDAPPPARESEPEYETSSSEGALAGLPMMDADPEPQPEPQPEPHPEPEPATSAAGPVGTPTPHGGMPTPAERATTAQGGAGAVPGGTIDALFGGSRPAGTSEDSAASALAQAFGGTGDVPVITGRPARAATKELSLDSVFRDGPVRPPRASQSFSFDQFFSENAGENPPAGGPTPEGATAGEPAERSADDVKQFNSWLQGLKPR